MIEAAGIDPLISIVRFCPEVIHDEILVTFNEHIEEGLMVMLAGKMICIKLPDVKALIMVKTI